MIRELDSDGAFESGHEGIFNGFGDFVKIRDDLSEEVLSKTSKLFESDRSVPTDRFKHRIGRVSDIVQLSTDTRKKTLEPCDLLLEELFARRQRTLERNRRLRRGLWLKKSFEGRSQKETSSSRRRGKGFSEKENRRFGNWKIRGLSRLLGWGWD